MVRNAILERSSVKNEWGRTVYDWMIIDMPPERAEASRVLIACLKLGRISYFSLIIQIANRFCVKVVIRVAMSRPSILQSCMKVYDIIIDRIEPNMLMIEVDRVSPWLLRSPLFEIVPSPISSSGVTSNVRY